MKLLLDTHTVLWFYLADPQLSVTASTAIVDPANGKSVSPASYWEVAIKISTGKYAIAQSFEDFCRPERGKRTGQDERRHEHARPCHAPGRISFTRLHY